MVEEDRLRLLTIVRLQESRAVLVIQRDDTISLSRNKCTLVSENKLVKQYRPGLLLITKLFFEVFEVAVLQPIITTEKADVGKDLRIVTTDARDCKIPARPCLMGPFHPQNRMECSDL